MRRLLLVLVFLLLFSACKQPEPTSNTIRVVLEMDGTRSTYSYNRAVSVTQFLDELEIERSPLDRINPPAYTQITDGMTITIVRVTEATECRNAALNYGEDIYNRTDLAPGSREVAVEGENGEVEICERIIYEDGEEKSRSVTSQTVLREPKNRVVYVGVQDNLERVPIDGTIAYISSSQAYVMQTNNTLRRPLTTDGGLDGRVFELSADGRQLLYTRQTSDPSDLPFSNELWVILDTENPVPVRLPITNVLTAAWRPGEPYTFSYSTANPTEGGSFQGWEAYNDLWLMTIDPETGAQTDWQEIMEGNLTGIFASWGTRFQWSPDGSSLAYAKANGVGLVDLATGSFNEFALDFAYFNPAIPDNWVWVPTLSWSQDSEWVILPVHGQSAGAEEAINSPIFDIGVFRYDSGLVLHQLIEETGMWANPAYSPSALNGIGFEDYQIAYLQARNPIGSYGAEYDLVIADRDGSNPRRVFPAQSQPGMRVFNLDGGEFAWSPTGRQIVIVYQRNLWLVDIQTGIHQQITNDGQVSLPRWERS
ncbi:MAG: G5 domain-containing protein [Anaerolineales bacterium]|nr:G5 domain-containing protein [Anaerolineales bacterium]